MKKLTVLRHSIATHGEKGGAYLADIQSRRLTPDGIALAQQRRVKLGKLQYDLVLASPALRAVQTAGIIAGYGADVGKKVTTLHQLCYRDPAEDDDSKSMDELFAKHGYAPLSTYQKDEKGDVVTRFGRVEWRAVHGCAMRSGERFILAVGHAVLINALGYAAVEANGNAEFRKTIAEANFGECEGFSIVFDRDRVTELKLIQ